MKIAVIGSRTFNDYQLLHDELETINATAEISLIVSGGAKGADSLAETYAEQYSLETLVFKPQYKGRNDRKAPLIRNKLIVEHCDRLIAFWDGQSNGTMFTVNYAKKLNKPVILIDYSKN